MSGAQESDFIDVRPKASPDEEKRYIFQNSISMLGGAGNDSSLEILQGILEGYSFDNRDGVSIVVSSVVVSCIVSNNATPLPAAFPYQGPIQGRVGIVFDTQYRSPPQPFGTLLDASKVWHLDTDTWVHSLERITTGDRYIVCCREPFTLTPSINLWAWRATNECFPSRSLPRFEYYATDVKINDNNQALGYSVTGGGLYDPTDKIYLNVGAIYNHDVSQNDIGGGGATVFPRVNVVNVAPTAAGAALSNEQVEFIPNAIGGFPGLGVIVPATLPNLASRIYSDPRFEGYSRDSLPNVATGGLTFPLYQHEKRIEQSLTLGDSWVFGPDSKVLDIEFDIPGGLLVSYKDNVPDTGLYLALTAISDLLTVQMRYQVAVYFRDGSVGFSNKRSKH